MIVPLRTDAITYGWEDAPDGKNFVVRIPSRSSSSDRAAVLQWLNDFARQIQRQHVFWIVRLNSFAGGYFLNVIPTDGIEDLVRRSLNW
jgi:hypothetical protein